MPHQLRGCNPTPTLLTVSTAPHRSHRAPVLSDRTLGRTLLARQQLSARARGSAGELIDRLVGLQAQAPLAPYVALWSRLDRFDPTELSELLLSRRYVRGHAMRSTIHLLSAVDFPPLRALSEAAVARNLDQAAFAGPRVKANRAALAEDLRVALADGPLPRGQLAGRLASRWGEELAASASSGAAILTPCVQATPRAVWGQSGPVMWATVEQWLGARLPAPAPSPAPYLLRYLAGFGPATVADMRAWSGWAGLQAVVSDLRPRLRVFRDAQGRELYDIPDGLIANPESPADVRFLPEYDNLHFAFAHRTRINPHGYPVPLAPGNGAAMGTFLVDGVYAGVWKRTLSSDGATVTLTIRPHAPLAAGDAEAVWREGGALLSFLAPAASPAVLLVS